MHSILKYIFNLSSQLLNHILQQIKKSQHGLEHRLHSLNEAESDFLLEFRLELDSFNTLH